MGLVPVQNWVDWDDPIWINSIMAIVIMANNMLHIHRIRDAIILVKFASISPQVWVIYNAFSIAFEM